MGSLNSPLLKRMESLSALFFLFPVDGWMSFFFFTLVQSAQMLVTLAEGGCARVVIKSPALRLGSSRVTTWEKREAEDARPNDYFCFDRAKVKNGLKIISTQTTNPAWSLSFDVNGKHIAAAVTAVRNFSVSTQPHQPRYVVAVVVGAPTSQGRQLTTILVSCPHVHTKNSQELFTWLLAVNVDHHRDSSELGDGVRALWSWTIRSHSTSPPPAHHHHAGNKDGLDEVKGKLTSRFEVLKDEVQSVFPIIKVILNLSIHSPSP